VTAPEVLVEPLQVIRRVKMKDNLALFPPPLDLHASLPALFKFLLCSLYVRVFYGGSGFRWI
jgi:hypothetical protein